MFIEIKSRDNEKFKYLKSLTKKKNRTAEKKYIVEGYRIVKQAIDTSEKLFSVFFSDDFANNAQSGEFLQSVNESGICVYKLDKKLFDEITDTQNSQGIVAIAGMRDMDLEDVIKKGAKFILVLDRIQDPGNMGTIIRTADAAGVDMIVLLKGCVDVYNQKVLRSTMGSVFAIPIVAADNSILLMDRLKELGFGVASSVLQTDCYYDKIGYPDKVALVIGNEANGIEDEIVEMSDIKVKIPIYGQAESLNAAIAAGILMYKVAGFLYCK